MSKFSEQTTTTLQKTNYEKFGNSMVNHVPNLIASKVWIGKGLNREFLSPIFSYMLSLEMHTPSTHTLSFHMSTLYFLSML